VGDNVLAKQNIKTGVPQCSIVGPLLLLYYCTLMICLSQLLAQL